LAFCDPYTKVSKRFLHSWQTYSKMGIAVSTSILEV
jgi:hypothetical protein